MYRIRRILCPVDFSPASDSAVQYAVGLAMTNNATLKLLHIVSPVIPSAYEYPIETGPLIKSIQDAATQQLNKLTARVKKTGVRLESEVQVGVVVEQIKQTIADEEPDIVILGRHSKGILDRLFLGSTAERVVRSAGCPVMVIPPAAKAAAERKTRSRRRAA